MFIIYSFSYPQNNVRIPKEWGEEEKKCCARTLNAPIESLIFFLFHISRKSKTVGANKANRSKRQTRQTLVLHSQLLNFNIICRSVWMINSLLLLLHTHALSRSKTLDGDLFKCFWHLIANKKIKSTCALKCFSHILLHHGALTLTLNKRSKFIFVKSDRFEIKSIIYGGFWSVGFFSVRNCSFKSPIQCALSLREKDTNPNRKKIQTCK